MVGFRIGVGYDSHRFSTDAERAFILGGVHIKNVPGLVGHSDADVLVHAIIDALLGAAAMGDIGSHFPDTDEKWAGADSMKMLAAVMEEIFEAGWRVGNVDAVVICERPKLRPYIDLMRERIAAVLGVDCAAVSIKGKTNEKMDDVGAGVGVSVHAVALLQKENSK